MKSIIKKIFAALRPSDYALCSAIYGVSGYILIAPYRGK